MTTGKDAGPFELLLTMDIRDELCSVDNQKKKTDGEVKITKKKKNNGVEPFVITLIYHELRCLNVALRFHFKFSDFSLKSSQFHR